MITSAQNPKLKLVRSLLAYAKARREAGAFVVEGVRLVEEAARSGWEIRLVLFDAALSERGRAVVAELQSRGVEAEEVAEPLMKGISETESPPGILAIVELRPLPLPSEANFLLIADQLRDPGNLGTLLRTAAATGVQAILLPPETADPFAPKVVRSGMGAHFRLPIQSLSWEEIAAQVRGLEVYLADMQGTLCWQTDLRRPLALIIGSEADGASPAARQLATHKISLPMAGQMESLNAGVAGSVLLFEVIRQRAGG